jgi:hypothetical protein
MGCGLSDDARYKFVCGPTLERIDGNVTRLFNAVFVSNGKPSILARLDAAEGKMKTLESGSVKPDTTPADSESKKEVSYTPKTVGLKAGKVEVNFSGYAINDIIRAVISLLVVYTLVASYMDKKSVDEKINAIAEQMKEKLP